MDWFDGWKKLHWLAPKTKLGYEVESSAPLELSISDYEHDSLDIATKSSIVLEHHEKSDVGVAFGWPGAEKKSESPVAAIKMTNSSLEHQYNSLTIWSCFGHSARRTIHFTCQRSEWLDKDANCNSRQRFKLEILNK